MSKGLHSSDFGKKTPNPISIDIFEGMATWEHFIDIEMAYLKNKISRIPVFLNLFFYLKFKNIKINRYIFVYIL